MLSRLEQGQGLGLFRHSGQTWRADPTSAGLEFVSALVLLHVFVVVVSVAAAAAVVVSVAAAVIVVVVVVVVVAAAVDVVLIMTLFVPFQGSIVVETVESIELLFVIKVVDVANFVVSALVVILLGVGIVIVVDLFDTNASSVLTIVGVMKVWVVALSCSVALSKLA